MEQQPLTITIRRATEYSGLSVPTIERRIASGELESIKVGRRRLIKMASLRKMLGVDQAA